MAKDYSRASMTRLIKDCISARDSRNGYIDHPATREIYRRLPPDLKHWYAKIMFEIGDPITLRGGPGDRDQDYFDHWRRKRDRDYPETSPDYVPTPDSDDGSDGAGAPPPGP
ncbi:hypothetical protein [Pannonibacter sp. P2PFMT1]|uniref:hypothetical protein n=1 Tax=Pannonibacter sp. P2PFMT1 TaxID=2003582 RepID=UPI0016482FFE|nr:hypothetical protein [Pannonibacter sp. P2PFMT1]